MWYLTGGLLGSLFLCVLGAISAREAVQAYSHGKKPDIYFFSVSAILFGLFSALYAVDSYKLAHLLHIVGN